MKTKIIPFDLETAKKIQAGEIDGKIITNEGNEVEIIRFNLIQNSFPILAIIRIPNVVSNYWEDAKLFQLNGKHGNGKLWLEIELSEETPKQKGELTLGKCKEGDEVWIYSNYEYGPEYVKVKVGKFSTDESSGRRRNIIFENGFTCQELTSQICWYENPDEQKTKTKEFEPFDKVLVRDRDDDEWQCDLFSHIQDDSEYLYVTIGCQWKQCIPYEGNEHLVNTTYKPK